MGIVDTVNSAIGKAFRSTASTGNSVRESGQGSVGMLTDSVSFAKNSGVSTIIGNYETVYFSRLVPRRIPAKKLEAAEKIARKLSAGNMLTMSEEDSLREDRIFAAIVGISLLQQGTEEIAGSWSEGLPPPTTAELEIASQRLTQRVSSPNDVADPDAIHKLRIALLDSYSEYKQLQKNIGVSSETMVASIAA